jgi:hypothetical protein
MDDIIERFNQLDLNQQNIAFLDWINKKNNKILQLKAHSSLHPRKDSSHEFKQWLLKKSLEKQQENRIKKTLLEQEKVQQQLDLKLQHTLQETRQQEFLLWKEQKLLLQKQKDIQEKQKQQDLITKKKLETERKKHFVPTPKPKTRVVQHKKPWIPIIEVEQHISPRKGKEPLLSPPHLYNELERYKKQCPNFIVKYPIHVARGR